MDLDATAITPSTAAPTPSSTAADRATFLARRFLGWFVDAMLLSAVVGISGLALMLGAMLFVGATVGLAGGGLEGLAAGGAAGFIAVVGVVLAMNAVAVGALLGYFAWAARRAGEEAGQTLGHQIAGVRVVRASDPALPVRGRRLLARELARYLWVAAVAIPAMFLAAATESPSLGNLVILIAVGAVAWCSAPDRLPHDLIARTRVIPANAPR
jgi:hypothetical protein